MVGCKIISMRKTKQLGIRIYDAEWKRLCAVQENIGFVSRGQKPEISEIIRSVMGWGNRSLVSENEKLFLAGDIPTLNPPQIVPRRKDESKRSVN